MRHFDALGPLLSSLPARAMASTPPVQDRDYLVLEDLVGGVIEFRLAEPGQAAEAPTHGTGAQL